MSRSKWIGVWISVTWVQFLMLRRGASPLVVLAVAYYLVTILRALGAWASEPRLKEPA